MKHVTNHISRAAFRIQLVMVVALVCAGTPGAMGQICAVNVDQGTIQGAVNNPACSTIFVSAGTFDESVTIARSLTLVGSVAGQTTISGQLVVSGVGVSAALSDLAVDGCFEEVIQVIAGATASTSKVGGVQKKSSLRCSSMLLFSDDFESGGTARWSQETRSSSRTPADHAAPTS